MKRILLISIFLSLILSFAGCANSSSGSFPDDNMSDAQRAAAAELNSGSAGTASRISLQGGADVLPYMLALSDMFQAENGNATVDVVAVGMEEALEAAEAGEADAAIFSVDSLSDVPSGAEVVAYACVAVIVNPGNSVTSLPSVDITDIFIGDVTNWQELGGEDAPVLLFVPDKDVPLRQLFEKTLPLRSTTGIAKSLIPGDYSAFQDEASVIQAVANEKNAIGICWAAANSNAVTPVEVDGTPLSEDAVYSGSYLLSRPIVYVRGASGTESAAAIADFAQSPQMKQVAHGLGLWPIQ